MKIVFNNDEKLDLYIKEGLNRHNQTAGIDFFSNNTKLGNKVGFEALENNQTIGGIFGKIEIFDYLHISLLFVDENYRGKAIGTKLIEKMENYAKENNLNAITLNTLSFQAKDFYVKLGYTIYGQFTDKKTGITKYNLIKQL